MSLWNVMGTGVSGLQSQATYLDAIGDNITNANTTGYKEADTEFSSMVDGQGAAGSSGGVLTDVRNLISVQGTMEQTNSSTDLAIDGNGYFVVSNSSGTPYLTRAGSFVENASGQLVNAAGYTLMGYSLADGSPDVVSNALTGLVPVTINQTGLQATASTTGTFAANLPASATAVAAPDLPSSNTATSTYTDKTSLVTYDDLGDPVTLDVYMTNTGADTWEVSAYNAADATNGGFPYSTAALAVTDLNFDPTTGALASTSPTSMGIAIPGGQTMQLDLSGMTQLGAAYSVATATVNGNAPSAVTGITISSNGTVYSVNANGAQIALYQIPLADVPSPDMMTEQSGNVFSPGIASGDVQIGFAGTGGFGTINSDSLEESTVDVATELTNMINAQRNYTADSKVIQTAATLMDILENLK